MANFAVLYLHQAIKMYRNSFFAYFLTFLLYLSSEFILIKYLNTNMYITVSKLYSFQLKYLHRFNSNMEIHAAKHFNLQIYDFYTNISSF